MAPGLAEPGHGDEHARTWKVAGVDCHPHSGRRPGRVAHSGEARLEGPAGRANRPHELQGGRGGELAGKIEALAERGEMHMAIDQAGENGEATPVHDLRIAWNLNGRAPAGVRHVPVLDQNDGLANGVARGRVEERVGVEGPNHRAMLMRR